MSYSWFKINNISYGWFEMRFGLYGAEVSDFLGYDMPGKFLDKVFRVIDQKTEEWLYLMGEPGAGMLHIYLMDDKIHFAEYRLSAISSDLNCEKEEAEQDKCEKCRFDMKVDIQDAIDGIVTEFSLYENGNGRIMYEEHWGAFPTKEYEQLKEYAFQLQENIKNDDELLCTTFLRRQTDHTTGQ